MACHGVISAGFCRNRFCIKLEITPPSISNHSRYGTRCEGKIVYPDCCIILRMNGFAE